jgi:hypothetical protein
MINKLSDDYKERIQFNQHIILYILMLVAALSALQIASAAVDNADLYYSFDDVDLTGVIVDDLSSITGAQDGTIIGVDATGAACKLDECFYYSGDDRGVQINDTGVSNTDWSLSVWLECDQCDTANRYFLDINTPSRIALGCQASGDTFLSYTVAEGFEYGTGDICDGTYKHLVIVTNDLGANSRWELWLNGHNTNNLTQDDLALNGSSMCVGNLNTCAAATGAHWELGHIDELAIYDYKLSAAQVAELYNSGAGYLPYPHSVNSNIKVMAYDYMDNTSISTFTATLNNGSSISTTNGTVWFENVAIDTYTFNVTYPSGYFNVTNGETVNVAALGINYDAYVYPWQAEISFVSSELTSGAAVTSSYYVNGTAGTNPFKLKAGGGNYYNVLSVNASYFNKTQVFNVTALDNLTVNVTGIYNFKLNIYFRDAANNSISNGTRLFVTGTDQNGYEYSLVVPNATDNGYNLTLINGYYNLSSLPIGYSYGNASINTTSSNEANDLNLYVYHFTTNSISFYYYDELNFTLINFTTITIELISDFFSDTYTTTTGSKYVDLLSPVEYNIRSTAAGYSPRNYFFTLENNTYNVLNLTMLPLGYGTNVTINVYDTLQNPIIGARVKILKYIVDLGSFITTDVRETNFEGQTLSLMELNSEYYKFIVEYDFDDNGVLDTVLTTDPTYIYSNTINLYINLLEGGFNELFRITGLYGVIDYDNETRIANFTYDDSDGMASGGCLYAYFLNMGEKTLINSSCVAGAANMASVTLHNITGTYELRGYITKGGSTYYLTQKYVTIGGSDVFRNNDGLLFGAILIIVMFFVGYFAIELAIILAGLATMILSFVGVLNIPASVTIPIFAISMVLAFIIGKNRTGGFA